MNTLVFLCLVVTAVSAQSNQPVPPSRNRIFPIFRPIFWPINIGLGGSIGASIGIIKTNPEYNKGVDSADPQQPTLYSSGSVPATYSSQLSPYTSEQIFAPYNPAAYIFPITPYSPAQGAAPYTYLVNPYTSGYNSVYSSPNGPYRVNTVRSGGDVPPTKQPINIPYAGQTITGNIAISNIPQGYPNYPAAYKYVHVPYNTQTGYTFIGPHPLPHYPTGTPDLVDVQIFPNTYVGTPQAPNTVANTNVASTTISEGQATASATATTGEPSAVSSVVPDNSNGEGAPPVI